MVSPVTKERWHRQRTRRMVREAARLTESLKDFSRALDKPGPYGDYARDLVKYAVRLAQQASALDGMEKMHESLRVDL